MANQQKEHQEDLICMNCEAALEEGFEFCPQCGQQTEEDLTVGVLFYNTISNYFSFDARFLRSFLPLMFKPGVVARRFVEGKRLKYLHPAQYYLFVSVIFFFILSFKVRHPYSLATFAESAPDGRGVLLAKVFQRCRQVVHAAVYFFHKKLCHFLLMLQGFDVLEFAMRVWRKLNSR